MEPTAIPGARTTLELEKSSVGLARLARNALARVLEQRSSLSNVKRRELTLIPRLS